MQDYFVDGRQIAKKRHIATLSPSLMQNSLGIIPMQYDKDRFISVGEDAF